MCIDGIEVSDVFINRAYGCHDAEELVALANKGTKERGM